MTALRDEEDFLDGGGEQQRSTVLEDLTTTGVEVTSGLDGTLSRLIDDCSEILSTKFHLLAEATSAENGTNYLDTLQVFDSFDEFILFLDKTPPQSNTNNFGYARKNSVYNMSAVLLAVMEALELLSGKYKKGAYELLKKKLTSGARLEHIFEELFMFNRDSTKKLQLDPVDNLDFFRLPRTLKGKKTPNQKKNFEARQFETSEDGVNILETTKNYFDFFSRSNDCCLLTLDEEQLISKSSLLPVDRIVFILPCRPTFLLSNFSAEQQHEAIDYYDRAYEQIKNKKKIFKIPLQYLISFNKQKNMFEHSLHTGIVWFHSPLVTISN